MHLLAVDEECLVDRIVVELPERFHVLADVTMLWSAGDADMMMVARGTHLMVINPMPAKMPMIEKSCQKSRLRIRRQPRMSTRWERSKSTLFWT